MWSTTDYLLAVVADALAIGNWQRSGGKGPRPKPITRPGKETGKRMGKARPLHEAKRVLEAWRAGTLEGVAGDRTHVHRKRGVTHGR